MLAFLGSSTPTYSYSEVQKALQNKSFTLEMLERVSVKQLLAVEEKGPNEGRTILWLLALQKDPTLFLEVWARHQREIALKDILVTASCGDESGMSLLSLVVNAMILDKNMTAPFFVVAQKFHEELTLAHLRKTVIAKDSKQSSLWTNSVFWLIAFASSRTQTGIFEKIAEKFQHEFSLADLRESRREGNFRKPNLLWFLAELAAKGKPEIFSAVWERFQKELSVEDFNASAQEGTFHGPSVLWLLAKAAIRYEPKPFFAVWEALKTKLTYEDLATTVKSSSGQQITFFSLLSRLKGGHRILFEIVTQMPGIPSLKLKQSLQEASSETFFAYAKNLFVKKEKLDNYIKTLNRKKLLNIAFEKAELEQLFQLGESALEAEYINAFYEIYKFLESTTMKEWAEKARRKISINSWFDEVLPASRAQAFYDASRTMHNNPSARESHLLAALSFATRATGSVRNSLIQKIACYYITGSTPMASSQPFLSQNDLKVYYSSIDYQRLSERLEELKKQYLAQHTEEDEVTYLATEVRAQLTFSTTSPASEVTTVAVQPAHFSAPTPTSSPRLS